MIGVPDDRHSTMADFWGSALGWQAGPPWPGHPELRSFQPPLGAPYVHLLRIDGPPGVHLDLESDDADATVARAVVLGAEMTGERDHWRTLRSPGGLPFCVLDAREHEPPEPVTWPDGHRTRMVQICIDSPRAVHDREVAFWRAVLPGRYVLSGAREFEGKWHDDAGSPIQLLFQRLDEAAGSVRAHLDHGTDDVAAEVRRLLDLGAMDLGPGRGWHVLRDVGGLAFCVTPNSPAQTQYRNIG